VPTQPDFKACDGSDNNRTATAASSNPAVRQLLHVHKKAEEVSSCLLWCRVVGACGAWANGP